MKSNFLVKAFGYEGWPDFLSTTFKLCYVDKAAGTAVVSLSAALGTIRTFSENFLGLDILVVMAIVFLIIAEFQTGVKVAMKKNKERFRSNPVGRMILKIGVYFFILFELHIFASRMKNPEILGLDVNPFKWVYWIVLVMIIGQFVISYFENLSSLGYNEARGPLGMMLRKYNQWFEFDGSKNPGRYE